MKIFRGEKREVGGCAVQVENDGDIAELSLEKSFEIVQHSPDWFSVGRTEAQVPPNIAAAILYEVTDDPELTRTYYKFFKFDHVAKWGETFEISELESHDWLEAENPIPAVSLNWTTKATPRNSHLKRAYKSLTTPPTASNGATTEAVPPSYPRQSSTKLPTTRNSHAPITNFQV